MLINPFLCGANLQLFNLICGRGGLQGTMETFMQKHDAHQDQQVDQKTHSKRATAFSVIKSLLAWTYRIWCFLNFLEGTGGDE